MGKDDKPRFLKCEVAPKLLVVTRRTTLKIVKIHGKIYTTRRNPIDITIFPPWGKKDFKRMPTGQTGTWNVRTFERKYNVNRDSPIGKYKVLINFPKIPTKKDDFKVKWKEV